MPPASSEPGLRLATVVETGAVELEIKTETGGDDHLHVEISETDAGRGADAFERRRTMCRASSAG
jgi:hypothetical protein